MAHSTFERVAANETDRKKGLVDVFARCEDADCKCVGEWLIVEGVEPEEGPARDKHWGNPAEGRR